MKTSKKVMITVLGILIASLISSMLLLRTDLRDVLERTQPAIIYETTEVDRFESLDISANWNTLITQSREFKVEIEKDPALDYRVETKDGVLVLSAIPKPDASEMIHARISIPGIKSIKAQGNAYIILRSFNTDSLHIVLNENVRFRGEENTIEHLTYETSGDVTLEFKDDPME